MAVFISQFITEQSTYRNTLAGHGGLIGMSMNAERLKIFDFSEVMYYEELLLVVLQGNEFSYDRISDLKGKKIGLLRAASYGEDFETARKTQVLRLDEDSSKRQRLLKLLFGRIDVAIIGPGKSALDDAIRRDEKLKAAAAKFVILPKPFKRDPNYLGFAKTMNMRPFLDQFNIVLKQASDSGELQKIIDNHKLASAD